MPIFHLLHVLPKSNFSNVITAFRMDLHVNHSRNNYGEKSIKVTGAKLYNCLPQNMKDSKTPCLFN